MAVVVVLKSQKEECHLGEDIFNASFHNDIKITIITWDSPNTANIVLFGGDSDGRGVAELKESPWRENCQCLFHKNITTITWASLNTAKNVSLGVLALWRV